MSLPAPQSASSVDDQVSDPSRTLHLALDWSAYDSYGQGDAYADIPALGGGFGKATALCIGSRQCQRLPTAASDKTVMCPSFRVTQQDIHSTRGRAAALRLALRGEAGLQAFTDESLDQAMDLCVACKGCKRECPNGVDMAALRAETLAQRWMRRRMPLRTRLFAQLPELLPWMHRFQVLLTLTQKLPFLAHAVERGLGISSRRSLPRLAATPYWAQLERAAESALRGPGAGHQVDPSDPGATPPAAMQRSSLTASGIGDSPLDGMGACSEIVLMVDCFANHLDPDVAHAAISVLEAAGSHVHLLRPPAGEHPFCCGRAAYSAGRIHEARRHAQRLLTALAPHIAAGRHVVGLEPSCLSMMRDEFLQLGLPAEQVQMLSRRALMLEEQLAKACDARRWPPRISAPPMVPPQDVPAGESTRSFGPATVHVHGHCHQKALGTLKAMRKVLSCMPGLRVEWMESSCCGMAGAFGFEAEHYDLSMRMAEAALLPAVRAASPQALILSSGTSCRHQIRDGAQREALHLAQVLHLLIQPSGMEYPHETPIG